MTFSRIVRRTHLYLALFLMPWMLMYALSTLVMNHRDLFTRGAPAVQYETERELVYSGVFPEGATPRMAAEQILSALELEGRHSVRGSLDATLTIHREDPITPRRITFVPSSGRLHVEHMVFRTPAFLERLHRRRGYDPPYLLDDAWALSVDVVIFALVFWAASGLWMWWELRNARRWGALCLATGLGLFGFFLLAI
jgi:hypothetical protein